MQRYCLQFERYGARFTERVWRENIGEAMRHAKERERFHSASDLGGRLVWVENEGPDHYYATSNAPHAY